MAQKKMLIVGSGGREHALAWKLRQSAEVGDIFVAPGNGGTTEVGVNVEIKAKDIAGQLKFAKDNSIDLTVCGPEDPLYDGIADAFRAEGLAIFGPNAEAAKLEGSKAFAKRLMAKHNILTAPFEIFDDYDTAYEWLNQIFKPVVIKASGPAQGKGAHPCKTQAEAKKELQDIMVEKIHAGAGDEVIIEDFLSGLETSIHMLTNGSEALLLPPSQDHKAAYDGDQGPNTGGMGCYAPIPWYTDKHLEHARDAIANRILEVMRFRGFPFSGCLYPGLMVQSELMQFVLEFNVRFGDPEAQVLMRLFKGDLFPVLYACAVGETIPRGDYQDSGFALCVVLASKGYPGKPETGFRLEGIEKAKEIPGIEVFHAGTKLVAGIPYSSGGRVLGITGVGRTLIEAQYNTYLAVREINPEGLFYRNDIGTKGLLAPK